MAFTEPVLLKRIPNDPAQRKLYWYDDYVATGGYASLRKALDMAPGDIIKLVTESNHANSVKIPDPATGDYFRIGRLVMAVSDVPESEVKNYLLPHARA